MLTDTLKLQQHLDELLNQSVYGLPLADKQQALLPLLNTLTSYHQQHCQQYQHIFPSNKYGVAQTLDEVPYLAVRLFKHLELVSVEPSAIFKTLQSSGTSGQAPARIFLDKYTSSAQSKALVKILQQNIGTARLPMLIIDSPSILKDKNLYSARGAGIQGISFFGRDHTYALDDSMQPNWPVIDAFYQRYQHTPVLIFGFTFMVWRHFVEQLAKCSKRYEFTQGYLLHSGGWKKLEQHKVDNQSFKKCIQQLIGPVQVNNFYGMAEQVGSIFVECSEGHLHTPVFADVIVRDPFTFEPLTQGQAGIIQVLSVLPLSYPGHSLLTEDMGTIIGEDNCSCGRNGKYFNIIGRLPKTEVRGCSDTHAA